MPSSSTTRPPSESDGGALREIARFEFPRQAGRERLCLADYVRPVGTDQVDVIALQVVTVGNAASERFETPGSGRVQRGLSVHGIAVEAAEAVAQWMHARIRRELALAPGRGKRYSWGYGACPDLDDHGQVFKLLPVEQALGMTLTSAFQLVPSSHRRPRAASSEVQVLRRANRRRGHTMSATRQELLKRRA